MTQIQELIKHLGLGIVSLLLLLNLTMDEYGKHKNFLKTIKANNFFGIQAINNQPFILSQDPNKKAKVRVFDSAEDSVKGFLQLMKTGDNYQGVRDAIARGDDVINYFDHLGKYAEKEDYGEYLKDVYVTRVLSFMEPKKDIDKLLFPKRKPMSTQMDNLK